MNDSLGWVIRTPHHIVIDARVSAVRVPTETGQVGLRPRGEPLLLAIEPGIVLMKAGDATRFAATAGGLCESDRERATLYTPFAVLGESADEVMAALDQALAALDGEIVARRRLGELEQRIVAELRQRPRTLRAREPHA
jgi:F0F1-type ATP synthase epsilon subunit